MEIDLNPGKQGDAFTLRETSPRGGIMHEHARRVPVRLAIKCMLLWLKPT